MIFLQTEATGRGKESSTMAVAITTRPGGVTGTTSTSSTGTRTTTTGTGDTWTPTARGATAPTACRGRGRMTSTAATETTGATGTTTTGVWASGAGPSSAGFRVGSDTQRRHNARPHVCQRGPKSGPLFLPSRHLQLLMLSAEGCVDGRRGF